MRDIQRVDQQIANIEVNARIDEITRGITTTGLGFSIPTGDIVTGVTYNDIVRTPFPLNNNQTAMLTQQVIDNARFRMLMDLRTPLDITTQFVRGPQPPSANYRLCCEIIDANMVNINMAIIHESYHQAMGINLVNSEPDYLWMGNLTYVDFRHELEQTVNMRTLNRIEGDYSFRFLNAQVMHDRSIPEGEIIFWHSNRRFSQLDRRLVNITINAH